MEGRLIDVGEARFDWRLWIVGKCCGVVMFERGGAPLAIFFFFQAEDGIRDKLVTGVQTCALPISEERAAIASQTSSLLDRVRERTSALQRDLGAADRARLADYLDTVREIERRVQLVSSRDLSAITVPKAPIGELNAFADQVDLLFDLIALAYRADLTRVASYIMVAEGTNRTYNHIGVSDAFHPVSHHANDLGRLEKLAKIQTWHVERFAAFLKKLAAVPDGDGTLLDHSMFLYGSNMSNSDRHNGHPLPTILVGGGNGALKGSQHLELREPTPLANLHLTILEKVGVEQKSFGDSTGTIGGV